MYLFQSVLVSLLVDFVLTGCASTTSTTAHQDAGIVAGQGLVGARYVSASRPEGLDEGRIYAKEADNA
jgi:uncharacterized protein YceK